MVFALRRRRRVATPILLQMQPTECGAAALGIVLGYHGRFVSLEALRLACGVSRDGARMSAIVHAAETFGLQAKGFQCRAEQALSTPVPFIAFWNDNHFLVVEGASAGQVYLNDPASGRYRVPRATFEARYSGMLIELHRRPDFQAGGQRQRVLPTLWSWTSGTRGALLHLAVTSLLLALPTLLLAAVTKTFIDQVLIRQAAAWLFPIALFLLAASVAAGLLTWLQQHLLLRLQTSFAIAFTSRFVWHLLRLPAVFYLQRYAGDMASRLQSCTAVAGTLSGSLPTTIVQTCVAMLYAAMMFAISPVLSACVLGLTLLNTLVVAAYQQRGASLTSVMLNASAKATGAAMAGLQAIETLKATGTEASFFQTWIRHQTEALNTSQAVGRLSLWLKVLPGAISQTTAALVVGLGALLVIDGKLSFGGLVAYQMMLANFQDPIAQVVGLVTTLQETRGHVTRLEDVLRHEPDPLLRADATVSPLPAEPRALGAVRLEGVSFGFSPLHEPLIQGLDLDVPAGARVAIAGASGSGKSTLARLIVGLYQPSQGRVLHGGHPIADIPRDVFTTQVAWVDQEVVLFEGTVFDNLTLWDPVVPRESVLRAARDACIHDVIAALPLGYETQVREAGLNFSGGQRQRLEIARALVPDPALLVLDEATAALDPITEVAIHENLRRRGVTCIIVAHRLSAVRDCDDIVVLTRGRIAEQGRHASLLARNGVYASLVGAA